MILYAGPIGEASDSAGHELTFKLLDSYALSSFSGSKQHELKLLSPRELNQVKALRQSVGEVCQACQPPTCVHCWVLCAIRKDQTQDTWVNKQKPIAMCTCIYSVIYLTRIYRHIMCIDNHIHTCLSHGRFAAPLSSPFNDWLLSIDAG